MHPIKNLLQHRSKSFFATPITLKNDERKNDWISEVAQQLPSRF